MWKNSIGYDPYGSDNDKPNNEDNLLMKHAGEKARNLMNLAKMNAGSELNTNTVTTCKKCGKCTHNNEYLK